jgi:hypothetical protein
MGKKALDEVALENVQRSERVSLVRTIERRVPKWLPESCKRCTRPRFGELRDIFC